MNTSVVFFNNKAILKHKTQVHIHVGCKASCSVFIKYKSTVQGKKSLEKWL